MERVGLHQRTGEDLAHVIIPPLARRLVEFHLQRGIKQHGFALDLVNIGLQFVHLVRPVFRHDKQRLVGDLLNVLYPLFVKPGGNMLDGVQTKTVAARLFHDPAGPVFYFLGDGMVAKVDVFAHQIIEVTHLVIDLVVPAFAGVVVDDFKNAVFIGVFNMIDTAEAFVIPDKLRILPGAGREGVACPCFTLNDLISDLRAVLFIHALYADRLFLICPHFMVDHHVQQYGNVVAFEGVDGLQQLRFVTIFCGDAAFLIKLAEIEQIVRVIANRIPAGSPFIRGRQPDHVDADFIEIGG